MSRSLAAACAAFCCCTISAQQPFEFLPGTKYDAAIPTVQQTLGYALGDEVSLHAEVEQYLRALAQGSARAKVFEYGKSWQGRRLSYLVLGSEQNLARLDAIRASMQRLADPRQYDDAAMEKEIADLPAVAWLAYTVHGDEPSGSDAALQLAYHLLAARDDALAQKVLQNCVVVVDPLQNPDGRDRFVHSTRAARGKWAQADPDSAEHTQPWPGGRVNHYLFDMNRDWFAISQPETAARVKAFQEWWPLVYVDLHEMGGNSTYYFAPPAQPLNPMVTPAQRDWWHRYGRNNGAWFDRFGFDYFTREDFDAFYPGYGDGWPTFQGSVGMTYEQASSRGIVYRRRDESELHYRDCVQRHFIASLATLETLADNRLPALRAFAQNRRAAISAGQSGPVREYVFPDRGDRTRLARLMNLLTAQGVEVHRAAGELRAVRVKPYLGGEPSEQTFPTGSYVVRMAQPAGHLAAVLLQQHFEMDAAFLAEQKKRQDKRQGTEFYDLTAWALPLLFDVETWLGLDASTGDLQRLAAGAAAPILPPPAAPAKVAYVVPWGSNGAAAMLVELLRNGVRARCLDKPFRLDGQDFPAGSFLVKVNGNGADVHARVQGAAQRAGVQVKATDSSWVESGIHFGSNNTLALKAPAVAMAWDRPAGANSAGWARFLLEQRYGVPVTPIRTQHLGGAELDRYTVLVLPDGDGYAGVIGKGGADRIKSWIERGGVLVTLGSATRWLTDPGVGLLATKPEDLKQPKPKEAPKDGAVKDGAKPADGQGDKPTEKPAEKPAGEAAPPPAGAPTAADAKDKEKDKEKDEPFDYQKAIQPEKEPPPFTPGAILRVQLDREHWLAFGYGDHANVVNESRDIYTPVKLDRGTNVGIYAVEDKLVLAGFAWPAAKKQLAQKAWLVHQPHGRGHIVAFAEDPNLRAFADGLNLFFLNAVLLGAGR